MCLILQVDLNGLIQSRENGSKTTECPKIYRKSVLHLLKYRYRFAVYLGRCSTDLR